MTTADFIAKRYNVQGKHQWCSSVLADSNGTIYSYGSHYPLAFNVKGLDFINDAGYSSTTSKHIAWARRALGYDAHSVKLHRADAQVIASDYSTASQKLEAITDALKRELKDIQDTMSTKKRKDTFIYHDLMVQETRVKDTLAAVKEVA